MVSGRKKFLSVTFLLLIIFILLGVQHILSYPLGHEPSFKEQDTAFLYAPPTGHISDTTIAPGDYLGIYIDNVTEEDELSLDTDLWAAPLPLLPYERGKAVLIPVSYHISPGEYKVRLDIHRGGQPFSSEETRITVVDKDFETQHLRVTATQGAQRRGQSKEEREMVRKARTETVPYPLWEEGFLQPVEGRITTEFGLMRYVNNELTGYRHSGLDIAASRGAPVKAANAGIVTLSRYISVLGNTVIIDHGLGISSSYYHLDELLVEEGDVVKKGNVIAKVGSTGFSTGPHLHWSMNIGTTFVNPWQFLAENPLVLLQN